MTIQGCGHGGRNQELALSLVDSFSRLPNTIFISLATDGEDGPTNAAGAVVTDETLSRGKKIGLDPNYFLANNDSYNFFSFKKRRARKDTLPKSRIIPLCCKKSIAAPTKRPLKIKLLFSSFKPLIKK